MAKEAGMKIVDKGIVIFREDTMQYFCGLNTWDKQLRKAKIFHSKVWVDSAIEGFVNDTRNPIPNECIAIYEVQISVSKKLKR